MSLTNYADLTAAVSSWTARSDYSAANYSDFTSLFEAFANRRLRTRSMETSTTLTPSSGSATLPTDYLAWRRVTWTGSTRVELEYVHPSILQAYYPSTPSDTPSMFTIEGTTLKVRPVDATGLEFDYFQKIPTLVSISTNWLMTAWPDLYLAGALTEAYLFNKDVENALVWKTRRDELAEEIRRLDFGSKGGTVRVMAQTP